MKASQIMLSVCMAGLSGSVSAQVPLSTAAEAPISIVVTGPATAAASSNIEIHIVLTNTSSKEAVGVPTEHNTANAQWNYDIKVTDDKGEPAQATGYGEEGGMLGARSYLQIQPGDSFEETFFLNKLFVLVPGRTYHVQVQHHHERKGMTALTAKSNIFTISITQ